MHEVARILREWNAGVEQNVLSLAMYSGGDPHRIQQVASLLYLVAEGTPVKVLL
mgnify:FL=1